MIGAGALAALWRIAGEPTAMLDVVAERSNRFVVILKDGQDFKCTVMP